MLIKSFILAMGFSAGIICQNGVSQMDKISPELNTALQADPQARVAVIISCKADCQKLIVRLEEAGINIDSLTPELNIISTKIDAGQAALLSKNPNVEFIELDEISEVQ